MADPRLEVVKHHLFTTGAFERNDPSSAAACSTRAWMIVDALDGLAARALSPSPPAPGGVPIRIAVAMTHEGDWVAGGRYGWTDEGAWQHCPSGNRWHRAAIITATVAPPVVAEIEGRVEAGGE